MRLVEVLPLVPVMWMTGAARCGSPSSSTARRVGSSRGCGASLADAREQLGVDGVGGVAGSLGVVEVGVVGHARLQLRSMSDGAVADGAAARRPTRRRTPR